MRATEITWKSSLPRYEFGKGVEYKVMFEDIPEYLKEEWLEYANGICVEEEIKNPRIEMIAILNKDGSLKNVHFQYYFDYYEYFSLTEEDETEIRKLFVDFVRKNRKGLPDAYNPKTDELMGEVEWEELKYKMEKESA
jgi:hypothetical protein